MRPVAERRILVAGASGSGKTTLAARIGVLRDLPHTEIDGLYWRAGWTANERFEEDVAAIVAGDAWVTEFQYRTVQPLLAQRAQLLVWLDLPRLVVLARVTRRTLRRRRSGELLWGVNAEPPLRRILTDRDHIVRFSMRTYADRAVRVRRALDANPGLRLVRLRSPRDVRRFLRLLERAAAR